MTTSRLKSAIQRVIDISKGYSYLFVSTHVSPRFILNAETYILLAFMNIEKSA